MLAPSRHQLHDNGYVHCRPSAIHWKVRHLLETHSITSPDLFLGSSTYALGRQVVQSSQLIVGSPQTPSIAPWSGLVSRQFIEDRVGLLHSHGGVSAFSIQSPACCSYYLLDRSNKSILCRSSVASEGCRSSWRARGPAPAALPAVWIFRNMPARLGYSLAGTEIKICKQFREVNVSGLLRILISPPGVGVPTGRFGALAT